MIAVTAVSTLPCPEIITTGTFGCWRLIASSSCSPSSFEPCSQMSRRISCGRRASTAAIASSEFARQARPVPLVLQDPGDEFADVVFVVDDQNVSSHQDEPILSFSGGAAWCSARRSGSLISTFGAPSAIGTRQPVEKIDPAAVVLEDLDDDRQPEPGPLGPRRHVGLDQPMPVLASESPCRCR